MMGRWSDGIMEWWGDEGMGERMRGCGGVEEKDEQK